MPKISSDDSATIYVWDARKAYGENDVKLTFHYVIQLPLLNIHVEPNAPTFISDNCKYIIV